MANFGKRMVKEPAIKEIGKGGTEYTAGEGIVISEDEISVDEQVIATKTDLGDYETKADSDQKITVLEYIKSPNDYLVEDPGLTNQEAVTKWIQNMPVFLGQNTDDTEIAALETAGFTNILTDTIGTDSIAKTKFHVYGYFIVVEENDASPRDLTGIRIYASDNLGATGTIFDTKKPARRVIIRKSGGTDYCVEGARFNTITTTLNTYVDPFNNAVVVQGFTNNVVNNTIITSKTSVDGGRYQETASLLVDNPVANTNIASQLKLPTTEGTYQLTCVIDANGKFTKFEWVLIS